MPERVTYQDTLFSLERVVQRTLEGGTILRLTLEPLPGQRVRVLAYRRKRAGERWVTDQREMGRTTRGCSWGCREVLRACSVPERKVGQLPEHAPYPVG